MADIDLKTETPDTTLPTTGFLFGADSQAVSAPSVYSTQTVATTLLGSTTLTGATVTADSPVLNLAQTWADGGANVTFTGLKFNATDTASAAASLLMDLQVGGSSRFYVRKDGAVVTATGGKFVSDLFDAGGGNQLQTSTGLFLSSSSFLRFNNDAFLGRRAAANLRLGAADAAAPVAQTLSVQSASATGADQAGANFTITGSQGRGGGAGGSIIFQVAPAGTPGSGAQNALADALTIDSTRRVTFASDIGISTGIRFMNGVTPWVQIGSVSFKLSASRAVAWTSGSDASAVEDTVLIRDGAANTLALRNGANAQAFRVYNTYTSATDFERANIIWDSNVLKIGTEKGSAGGTARALEFQTDGATALTIDTSQRVFISTASFAPLKVTRNLTAASGAFGTSQIVAKTSVDMTDGFGPALVFSVQDNNSGEVELGGVSVVRAGADNIGDFIVRTNNTGTIAERFRVKANGNIVLLDAANMDIGTTTGTKIGTATTQKLAFWNATPIVQPTTGVTAATFAANTSGITDDTATFDGYTIGQVVAALRSAGLLA